MNRVPACLAALAIFVAPVCRAQEPPSENRYDIIGKVFRPFWSVLLAGGQDADRAASLRITMNEVTGRLPKEFQGATLDAAVEFPDKVKLVAPVLGEEMTVCRNGAQVWATPGEKVEFLLKQFKLKLPKPTAKANTPLFLPITAQQAIFLPAVFIMEDGKVFKDLNGESCRVISGRLVPELDSVTKAPDFRASLWIAAGYLPRRVDVIRRDFTASVAISDLKFAPSFPASMWQPPPGVTDVYRTTPDVLEQLLFVVMNSLQSKDGDQPWLKSY